LAVLGKRWEVQGVRDKLARWLWCGVFGELYGGTTETRFARDLPDVLAWVNGGPEPRTVVDAVFAPARLLSLRTRGSAAYKGIYALLLREGARDLRTGELSNVQNYFDERVDIHHLFPQRWCREQGISPAQCDSIVNKTPLSARTNRVIGGRAPGEYLSRLQNSAGITADQLDAHLRTHLVDPALLRADDFQGFFAARQTALLGRVEQVTGKRIDPGVPAEPEDEPAEYEVIEGYDDLEGERRTSPSASPSSLANYRWATSCSARSKYCMQRRRFSPDRPWGLLGFEAPTVRSQCQDGSATTSLARTPMPSTSTSTSTWSPASRGPTPAGVPVRSTSPGSRVITRLTKASRSTTPFWMPRCAAAGAAPSTPPYWTPRAWRPR
jgi:hypothetical protein